nr:hypothetical protein [Clostridium celatum]
MKSLAETVTFFRIPSFDATTISEIALSAFQAYNDSFILPKVKTSSYLS